VDILAERVAKLRALKTDLTQELRLKDGQVAIRHGGLSDVEQQDVVESFKKKSSPIRVLVTGDLASEGVTLHSQCHELVHFDIPWSLIRSEQRNGRIDRSGQTQRPQITTLVLQPDSERFSGDIRVLKKLIEKENEAHTALGDAAALMGKYTAEAEEEAIKAALAKGQDLDEVVTDVDVATQHDEILDLIMNGLADDTDDAGDDASKLENPGTNAYPGDTTYPGPDTYPTDPATGLTLYPTPVAFLQDGLAMVYRNHPEQRPGTGGSGGVNWQFHSREAIAELEPPRDMWSRLESLPQSYLKERGVKANFKLATNKTVGRTLV